MQNAVTTFNFNGHNLSCILDEAGNPLFRADDVCEILEFENPRTALANHVEPEDVLKQDTLTAGGVQAVNHINESGLYSLIFGSKKPAAKAFKHWVTSEVLPAIRKTGAYVAPSAPAASPVPAVLTQAIEQSLEMVHGSLDANFSEYMSLRKEINDLYSQLPQRLDGICKLLLAEHAADIKGFGLMFDSMERRFAVLEKLVARIEQRLDRLEDRAAA